MAAPTLIVMSTATIVRAILQLRLIVAPVRSRTRAHSSRARTTSSRPAGRPTVHDLVEVARERVEVVELQQAGRLAARQRVAQRQQVGSPQPDQAGAEAQPQRRLELTALLSLRRIAFERRRILELAAPLTTLQAEQPALAPPGDAESPRPRRSRRRARRGSSRRPARRPARALPDGARTARRTRACRPSQERMPLNGRGTELPVKRRSERMCLARVVASVGAVAAAPEAARVRRRPASASPETSSSARKSTRRPSDDRDAPQLGESRRIVLGARCESTYLRGRVGSGRGRGDGRHCECRGERERCGESARPASQHARPLTQQSFTPQSFKQWAGARPAQVHRLQLRARAVAGRMPHAEPGGRSTGRSRTPPQRES